MPKDEEIRQLLSAVLDRRAKVISAQALASIAIQDARNKG